MEYFTIINFVLVFLGLSIGFVISKFLEKTSITKSLENAKKETENISEAKINEEVNKRLEKINKSIQEIIDL